MASGTTEDEEEEGKFTDHVICSSKWSGRKKRKCESFAGGITSVPGQDREQEKGVIRLDTLVKGWHHLYASGCQSNEGKVSWKITRQLGQGRRRQSGITSLRGGKDNSSTTTSMTRWGHTQNHHLSRSTRMMLFWDIKFVFSSHYSSIWLRSILKSTPDPEPFI